MLKNNKNIHKYFRVNDIVRCEDIWGKKLFIVDKLAGNWYLPELVVHPYGLRKSTGNTCNFDVRDTKLIMTNKRPFKKLKKSVLIKLIKKGNIDAIREFILRNKF